MSKTIATDLTGTTITFSDGSNSMNITGITKTTYLGNSYYSFTFTPTFATTTGKFTITNAKDTDNNVYALVSQSNLTIKDVLPSPSFLVDASVSSGVVVDGTDNVTSIKDQVSNTTINASIYAWLYNISLYSQNSLAYLKSRNNVDAVVDMTLPTPISGDFTFTYIGRYKYNASIKYVVGFTVGTTTTTIIAENNNTYTAGTPTPLSSPKSWVLEQSYMITIQRVSNTITAYVDGVLWGVIANAGSGDLHKISIGPGFGLRFDTFETAVYNSAISSSSLALVRSTKFAKWGI